MPNKYTTIQKKLDTLPKLFLDKYSKEYAFSDWDMKDFILQFLVDLCYENNTMIAGTSEVFCKPAKRRSISDIYNLCRYYYDDVTFIEVQCALASLWNEKKIGYFYCNSTKKRVYMSWDFYKGHTVNPVSYAEPDEWKIPITEMKTLAKTDYKTLL